MLTNGSNLKFLLEIFPLIEEISLCFAYGSAVFKQGLDKVPTNVHMINKNSKMIDLILAVNDPIKWHHANLTKNWSHYSSLGYLGSSNISKIQRNFGAKIYYNTLVPIDKNILIKYGIISTEDLINDLIDWETLYISGRLHKPISILHTNFDNTENRYISLEHSMELNRQSALHSALLLLPEKFTEFELYKTITNLSYSGDFRMWFGEDRSKVEKIVNPQMDTFHQIYSPIINSNQFNNLVQWCNVKDYFEQNLTQSARQYHLNLLPKNIQIYMVKKWLKENTSRQYQDKGGEQFHRFDIDDLMRTISFDIEYSRYLREAIKLIVFQSSVMQTIKGFLTAGLTKSFVYSGQKIQKMFQSL